MDTAGSVLSCIIISHTHPMNISVPRLGRAFHSLILGLVAMAG